MEMMKAAIYKGLKQIEVQQVEKRAPDPGYVILDTKRTGICGSDLHNYFGNWAPSNTVAAGHETCGVVAEVGEGVTAFEIGDKVTAECFSHCGQCTYCRTGYYNHCQERRWISDKTHGGFAEFTTVHTSGLFKLPDNMSFEDGVMVEPLAVSYRAVVQADATHQDRVVIIGGGTIGQLCLAAAKAMGVKETIITAKYDQQIQLAHDLGADHVVDIRETDLQTCAKDLTNGLGVDVVIETVGGSQNFDTALDAVRKCGTVVLVAGYHKPLEVNLARIVWSEIVVTGSNCYGFSNMQTDFDAAIELIDSGRVEAKKLVTHRFPFDEIAEAFRISADKSLGAIKVHVCQ